MPRLVGELDAAAEPLLDAAAKLGAQVWVVSEYGHCDVNKPVFLNQLLRRAGLLVARPGPFGEVFDPYLSRAFAVCDHQLAHVYVNNQDNLSQVHEMISRTEGVARLYAGDERAEIGLDHARSGELIVLSKPDAWFAYPFWLDDRNAPDYARTVDIHRKPGYDPCELFLDPQLTLPKGRLALRLLQKKLGFRTLFDVVPLDATIVHGSHGLHAAVPDDGPLVIGYGTAPPAEYVEMTQLRDLLLDAMDLAE
jgi:hypothetical protein